CAMWSVSRRGPSRSSIAGWRQAGADAWSPRSSSRGRAATVCSRPRAAACPRTAGHSCAASTSATTKTRWRLWPGATERGIDALRPRFSGHLSGGPRDTRVVVQDSVYNLKAAVSEASAPSPGVLKDVELVAAARAGSRAAFKTLIERHQRVAYSFAFSLTG